MKSNRLYQIIFLVILFQGCLFKNDSYMQPDKEYDSKEIINYEFSNNYYQEQIKTEHFKLNIIIDKPVIINITKQEISDIYCQSDLNGSAIIQFSTDKNGKIIKYDFLKRAGIGIDNYIENLIKIITFKPLSHQGDDFPSTFYAKFVFSY